MNLNHWKWIKIIKSRISYASYACTWLLFWTKKYTPSIYKWLKFFWTTQKSFWFTNRILLPCYQWISSLKRISEKFRVIQRLKHWMQFISLVAFTQLLYRILLLNSKTISGDDWPIWTKDVTDMAQSPLELKQWSLADILILKRKLNNFQRMNESKCITGGYMKYLKKHVKEGFVIWWHLHFIWNSLKSKNFIFRYFAVFKLLCFKLITRFLSEIFRNK